jgi:hypothetical protein
VEPAPVLELEVPPVLPAPPVPLLSPVPRRRECFRPLVEPEVPEVPVWAPCMLPPVPPCPALPA